MIIFIVVNNQTAFILPSIPGRERSCKAVSLSRSVSVSVCLSDQILTEESMTNDRSTISSVQPVARAQWVVKRGQVRWMGVSPTQFESLVLVPRQKRGDEGKLIDT